MIFISEAVKGTKPPFFVSANQRIRRKEMKMETQKTITFYCYRPSLTTKLSAAGYKFKTAPSPWDANRVSWIFELDRRGAELVKEYYENVGRDVPRILSGVLE